MDGSNQLKLERFIATTDRGALWIGTRQRAEDRIVRLIESRFCDLEYRKEGRALCSTHYQRTLQVVGEGWMDGCYYLEYLADSPWETLETHFQRLHWRSRLQVMLQICDALSQWSSCPVRPLGLNGRNILMLRTAGRWYPWLLPAPPLKHHSPCDLFGYDAPVLAALAPEEIRGVPFDERARDSYALGYVGLSALGCRESSQALTDEERIERQACGALVSKSLKQSAVEDFLQTEETLQQLIQSLRHYTQLKPIARPSDTDGLREACAQAFAATDPNKLADDLRRRGNWAAALHRLGWGLEHFGENLDSHLLAADIYEQLGDLTQAISHYDRATLLLGDASRVSQVSFEQLRFICQRRSDARWALLGMLPPLNADDPDPEGDALLTDLTLLKQMNATAKDRTEPYIRAAAVYRRRQDFASAANELFEAVQLEPADFGALLLYGACFRDLGGHEAAEQVVQEANRRLDRMVTNQMIEESEAQQWRGQFAMLLVT